MKNIYFYIVLSLVALAGFASCSDDKLEGTHQMDNSISIIKQDVCFDAAGGQGTITFEAPGVATVTSSADWCQTSVSGSTVTVTVSENTSYEARNAVVTIACGSASRQVSVVQNGIQIWFTYETQTIEVPVKGGTYKVSGVATDTCKVTSDVDWITAGIDDNGDVTIVVAKNLGYDKRTGKVTISAPSHDNSVVITIKQVERTLPAIEGTYSMVFYTKQDESAADTIDVTLTKSATEDNVYIFDLSAIHEDLTLPMTMDAENRRFVTGNTQAMGTWTVSQTTYYVNAIVNYQRDASNYISYNKGDSYNIALSYGVNDDDKYTMEIYDVWNGTNNNHSTGFSVYLFKTDEPIKANLYGSALLVRKPKLVQK